MFYKYRYSILILLIMIFIYGVSDNQNCYSEENLLNKKVLVLASYNSQSKWEASVIKGLKKSLGKNITLKVDYLDAKSIDTDIYNESFVSLLNIKYANDSIDCIFTIDDEALELVRNNLFNQNSFMYKKPVVFVGANSMLMITKEESEYVTGILQQQDNLADLDLILNNSKQIDDIYLLLDKSVYSDTLKENIKSLKNFTVRPFNIEVIEEYDFEKVKEKLKEVDDKKSAIILCGSYNNSQGDEIYADEIVEDIKAITKAPLYTKVRFYADSGAIGGIINDGYGLGILASNFLKSVLYENNKNILNPSPSSITRPYYNYDALMYYDINPLKLPKDSVFINKGPLDFLIPKELKVITWICIILIVIFVLSFVKVYISNKKKVLLNDRLLNESIEREEIKTDFILTVSHELRTPLNIIINASKLIMYKINNKQYNEDFVINQLEMINKNSNRLLRLVNNLIDVSKIETGYMDTTFKNENIVDVVEDATLSVVDLANTYNITVTFDTEEEEIITSVDRAKIERVMLNLLSNSIKFTKDGGEIFVTLKRKENAVIIEVKDNGIGMSHDLQSHLFEKFKRAKTYPSLKREHEGSGLGLFIVKGLIEVHKGTIDVNSKINEGTTFTISIPIAMVDVENANSDLMKMPIEYVSQIELADILEDTNYNKKYDKKEK